MYPTLAKTRAQLPSLSTVSGPIEQYYAALQEQRPLAASTATSLEALDAYLVHLFLNCHPETTTLLDLAAEATAGASSLLGLLHPRVKQVRALGGPLPGDRRAYRGVVEDFLFDKGQALSCLEWLSSAELSGQRGTGGDIVLFIEAGCADMDAEVERCLNAVPSAVVLIFGLGAVGDCAAIDALLRRFPSGSPRRFTLWRESGEALSASRLGMVASRDNPAAKIALVRLKQLFTGNYSFLGLLRSATEQAIRSSSSDGDVQQNGRGLFTDWNEEIKQLKQAAAAANAEIDRVRQAAAAQADELHALKGSIRCLVKELLRRLRRRLAPDQTRRHRLFQILRRAAQIRRQDGLRGLMRRIVRRCLWRRESSV
jgi:hypothetical protein